MGDCLSVTLHSDWPKERWTSLHTLPLVENISFTFRAAAKEDRYCRW